jgi:hypothetical protein
MNKGLLIRGVIVASLFMLIVTGNSYAPALEKINFFYSDSAFTNEVGEEGWPGLASGDPPEWCDCDSYWYEGDISAPYRKTVYYAYCNWQVPMMGTVCDYYDNGSWHAMTCP